MTLALDTLLRCFDEGGVEIPARALFMGAEYAPALGDWPDVTGWQIQKPEAVQWERESLPLIDEVEGKWPAVIMLPGKSKEAVLVWMARAIDVLEDGGLLLCSLPNTGGAVRFSKELKKALGPVESFTKNKCRGFWVRKGEVDDEVLQKWRNLDRRRKIRDTDFVVNPGVFSSEKIDAGSAFLAEHFPKRIHGRVADLGAGWGYLSHELLKRCRGVKHLDLYEADRVALECARVNVTADIPIEFHWHDVAAGIAEGYDSIVMNPPFHKGLATDVSLGRGFLRSAHAALKRHGELFIVANKQLPYEGELDELGMRWRIQAENETFKLLFAAKR